MGRDVTIYGFNYQQIALQLSVKFTTPGNNQLLHLYCDNEKSDYSDLITKLHNDPRDLNLKQLNLLIWAFNDFRELSNNRFDYQQRLDQMATLGITQIFATSATNPSCVFMEIFQSYQSQDEENSILEGYDAYLYRLSRSQWQRFLTRLITITEFFREQAGDQYQYDQVKDIDLLAEAEQVYLEQVRLRDELKEQYDAKWAANYFDFSWYCEEFINLSTLINDYDEFMLVDSY